MPQLPHSIELHDSHLATIERASDAVILKFRPAYVHRDGKGWRQDADLTITGASMEPAEPELPVQIADGFMESDEGPYHNLLHLPLRSSGPIDLRLELLSGDFIHVQGRGALVTLHGDPRFVEDFN